MPIAPPTVPQAWICITLPVPPSANNLYFNAPGRGRVKTQKYHTWANEAGWAVRQQFSPLPHYGGFVYVDIDLPGGLDIDNAQKAALDLLQTPHGGRLKQGLGIIKDDKAITDLHIRRVPPDRPFTVRLRAA
jgi:hypothetical protein